MVETIDAQDFVSRVQPALEAQDWDRLIKTLTANWSGDQIASLLHDPSSDARKIAALAIGLIGQTCYLPELSEKLRDQDRMVVDMAEHAMWQIWFRGGSDAANVQLARGAAALNRQEIEEAVTFLDRAIQLSPDFPEAYNQRAIAHYLAERYAESIRDCERVIELMPLHFGAWSGLGHSHLALDQHDQALTAYEQALKVNPHLECIAELVQELREQG